MSQDILLNLIDPDPEQPRKHFDSAKIGELAQSMDAKGLVIPILVRPDGERFIIVHGERRFRAALSLGWQTIMADVRDITPSEARWLSLIENVQRQDLSPIEEARAYQERLAEGITQTELGQRIGKSQSYIAQKLRLLGLPGDVQEAVASDAIKEGHARQLLKLKDADKQSELCQRAIVEQWTVKRTEIEVNEALRPKNPTTPAEWIISLWEERGRIAGHDPYPEERLPEYYNPPIEIKRLPVCQIVDDPKMDPRTDGRDMAYPEWLAEIFIALPPIAVFNVGDEYILADGRYRMAAAKLLGLQEVECRIYEGKERFDAELYGITANCGGGLRLTKSDIQRNVLKRFDWWIPQ